MGLRCLVLGLSLVCLLAGSVHAEIIFLKDGRFLQVKVLSGDERGVTVKRLDNDGQLYIRWRLLREEDAKRLRIQFGLEEDDSNEDFVMLGQRVYPRRGDYKNGLVVARTQDHVTFKHMGKTVQYLTAAIRKIEDREVSVFDVYTPEELYQRRLEEKQPSDDDVEGHDHMATWATRVGMYDDAMRHYQQIRTVDTEFKADYISNQIKRLEILARNKDILNAVKEAVANGHRRRFDRCLAILDEVLAQADLDATLRVDVEKKKERFTRKRWEHFSKLVVSRYFREVHRRIDEIARSRDVHSKDKESAMTIDKAMTHVKSKLHKEVVDAIGLKYALDPKKEVEKMWKERTTRSTRTASYGAGTFIVQKAEKSQSGGNSGQSNAMAQRLEELMSRARSGRRNRNQQQQQQAKVKQKLMTKDQWWKRVDSSQRSFWLRAYYAEQGNQMVVVNKWIRNCTECGATGTIKQTGPDGTLMRLTCPRCQGRKADRVVVYR